MVMRGAVVAFLQEFSTGDLALVRLSEGRTRSGRARQLIIPYAHFTSGRKTPSGEVRKLVNYCWCNEMDLVVGCDVNVHSRILESTDDNQRPKREGALGYLLGKYLK